MVAAVVFGLLPAWLASRNDVVTTLKQQARGSTAGRGQRLARHALIVAEVSLALALLAVAGVMIRGFDAMLQREPGWDTRRVLVAKGDKGWKVYDVVAEDVSVVNNYRSQFNRVLAQSSFSDLIRRMKDKE